MVDEEFQRGMIGEVGLKLVPEAVRQSMLADPDFLKSFGLSMKTDGTISFGNGPKFASSLLFTAIRQAEKTDEPVLVRDKQDQQWSVAIASDVNGRKSPGVCQTCCPPISCGVSDFRDADFGFGVKPDGSGGLPVAGFS